MNAIWAGVLLAALSTIGTNIGVALQKKCHLDRAKRNVVATFLPRREYWQEPVWLVAMSIVILSSLLDFIALGLATQIIIAPVGALSLVSSIFSTHFILGESISRLEISCTIVMVIGAVIVVISANIATVNRSLNAIMALYSQPSFLAFAAIMIFLMLLLLVLNQHQKTLRKNSETTRYNARLHRFACSSLSGLIGSWNVLFAKCLAELFMEASTGSAKNVFSSFFFYLISLGLMTSIVLQFKFLNSALKFFQATFVIPVFQLFWLLGSILSGLIFFQEYRELSTHQLFGFSVGSITTLCGVSLLSCRNPSSSYSYIPASNHDDEPYAGA